MADCLGFPSIRYGPFSFSGGCDLLLAGFHPLNLLQGTILPDAVVGLFGNDGRAILIRTQVFGDQVAKGKGIADRIPVLPLPSDGHPTIDRKGRFSTAARCGEPLQRGGCFMRNFGFNRSIPFIIRFLGVIHLIPHRFMIFSAIPPFSGERKTDRLSRIILLTRCPSPTPVIRRPNNKTI